MFKLLARLISLAECFRFVPELVTRVTVGMVFVWSGWGKLHNLPRVIDYFTSLGIPAAHIQAPFASAMEFGCGALLVVGLAARFASIPLMIIMMVAIRTAKWGDIKDLNDLFGLSEFLYIALLLWIATLGPGKISIDHMLKKKLTA